jgi:UDP-N-acetylglucosamine 4,6-dehydratase/5-epimerase|tara:strand:- start:19207 stop:20193 length:987 start_codon:yes stop_codon:yes gene_type:complete
MFKNKSILITGGTGSFGKNFVNFLLKKNFFSKIIIFSRDELKQFEMKTYFKNDKRLRFFIGDIRDYERLKLAFENVDFVIHAAALKQVDTGEYNPVEFIKTNIIGSQNVVQAAFDKRVKKVIALSTDKASSPINLYGATKLCSDKLFCLANNMFSASKTNYSVVRYGNVMMSRGSIIPIFKEVKNNIYKITDPKMTRFNISMNKAIELVIWSLKYTLGGEIVIPNIKSYKILDLVKSFSSNPKINIIGIRRGEKIDEEMISSNESRSCFVVGDKFILSSDYYLHYTYYKKNFKIKKFDKEFYRSNQNQFLSPKEIKSLIEKESKNYID